VKYNVIKLLITHKNIELKVRVDTLVTETFEFGICCMIWNTHDNINSSAGRLCFCILNLVRESSDYQVSFE